jgi:hypothetical protein
MELLGIADNPINNTPYKNNLLLIGFGQSLTDTRWGYTPFMFYLDMAIKGHLVCKLPMTFLAFQLVRMFGV